MYYRFTLSLLANGLFLMLSFLMFTGTAQANSYVEASFGIAQMNSSNEELDSNEFAPYRIYYGYSIAEGVYLETGYLAGDNFDNESQNNFELDSMFINIKGLFLLNNNYAIFAKFGTSVYQYELQNDDDTVSIERGLGYSVSTGWEFVLENRHILVGLEYENSNSVRMETNIIHGNVQYRF